MLCVDIMNSKRSARKRDHSSSRNINNGLEDLLSTSGLSLEEMEAMNKKLTEDIAILKQTLEKKQKEKETVKSEYESMIIKLEEDKKKLEDENQLMEDQIKQKKFELLENDKKLDSIYQEIEEILNQRSTIDKMVAKFKDEIIVKQQQFIDHVKMKVDTYFINNDVHDLIPEEIHCKIKKCTEELNELVDMKDDADDNIDDLLDLQPNAIESNHMDSSTEEDESLAEYSSIHDHLNPIKQPFPYNLPQII